MLFFIAELAPTLAFKLVHGVWEKCATALCILSNPPMLH
jgi:hypothetical protein